MNYLIFTYPQVSPRFHVVHGALADQTVPNPGPPVILPPGNLVYRPADYDIYAAAATQRTMILETTAAGASSADIFTACPRLRDWKASQIRSEGDSRLQALAHPYEDSEQKTWPIQMAEAEAWLINPASPTPMLTQIANNRGITLTSLVGRVMENVVLFRSTSGAILGQQQALLDRVYIEEDFSAFLSIGWT